MADKNGDDAVFLSIDNIPVYFQEDWQIGTPVSLVRTEDTRKELSVSWAFLCLQL